ncbi:MAG: ATP-binding protein [Gammaproteobacteria bacterium]|nr:ATP-binding protein [Gammaproteobacteria bacterium]
MWLDRGGYRLRIPLSLTATSAVTALVLGLVIALHTYRNLEQDLVTNGLRLGVAMASTLQSALKHDDVWLAYTVLRGAREDIPGPRPVLIVVDAGLQIFAANQPRSYPAAMELAAVAPDYGPLAERLRAGLPGEHRVYREVHPDGVVLAIPLLSEGVPVGALLMSYSDDIFWPRFWEIAGSGALSMAVVMAVIAVVGWYWGDRMARPLARLASCMGRVGRQPFRDLQCYLSGGDDEIGRLEQGFREMLEDLRSKEELEREMVVSERLAAVGRLAAGVAHEINNPLAGMLMAVNNIKRRGDADPQTARTLDLIERGLHHIHETVSALLVEAAQSSRPLGHGDIEDVRMLAASRCRKEKVRLDCHNELEAGATEILGLPSAPVRQVLLNLLLNGAEAAAPGGWVRCRLAYAGDVLVMEVRNSGRAIPREQLEHLFEPFFSTRADGSGLGLWVSYQIIQRLGGEIHVTSNDDETLFRVTLPRRERLEAADAA